MDGSQFRSENFNIRIAKTHLNVFRIDIKEITGDEGIYYAKNVKQKETANMPDTKKAKEKNNELCLAKLMNDCATIKNRANT